MKKRLFALLLGLTIVGSSGVSCFAGDFRMRHQEKSNWCWVAVGQALLTEYHIDVTQDEFFEAAFFGVFSDLEALGRKRPEPGKEGEYQGGSEEICESMNLFLLEHDKKVRAHPMTILLKNREAEAQAHMQEIAQIRSKVRANLRAKLRAKSKLETKAKASAELFAIAQAKVNVREQMLTGMIAEKEALLAIQAQTNEGTSALGNALQEVQSGIEEFTEWIEKIRAEIKEFSEAEAEARAKIEELSKAEAEARAELKDLSRAEAEARNVAQQSYMLQDDQDALSQLSDIINLLQHETPVAFRRGGHWVVLSGIRFPAPEDADQTVYVSVRNTDLSGEQGEDSLHPLVEYFNSEKSGQLNFVYIA